MPYKADEVSKGGRKQIEKDKAKGYVQPFFTERPVISK
jgi:hypothetical protein